MKKVFAFILALVLFVSLVGCNKEQGKQVGKKGTLSLNVYVAGYGTDWIDSQVRCFNELYPDVKVKVEGSPLALDAVKTLLENGNCPYDIVLIYAVNYNTFVGKGYLENLTDLYDSTIPGTDKTVRSCVIDEILDKYTVEDGKIYGVSWQPNYASGLVYNKAMFNQYGWEIPETMDELFELFEQIDEDTNGAVSPLVFGGADGNGYLLNTLPQWLLECYGSENYKNFLNLESPKVYEDQAEGRDKIYKTLAKLTKGVSKNGNSYSLDGSVSMSAINAQTNFVNGRAAMIVNGTWFCREMEEYLELRQFEVGYMPMPHINSDKKSLDGTIDTSNARYSSDNGVFAIPSTSVNKELAKDFLASMMTSKSYSCFIEKCFGLNRFFKNIEVDQTNFSDFAKSAFNYFTANDNADIVLEHSRDKLLETSTLAVFFAYKGSFFEHIAGARTYEEAYSVASGCVANELEQVYQKWDPGKSEWKS